MAVSIWCAIPRTWVSPTMGERPTTGAEVAVSALADAGHAEDRAHGHDRVGRRHDDEVGVTDGVQDAGRRGGLVQSDEGQGLGGHLGVEAHPVLLEVDDALPARRVGVGDRDVRLDAVVGHRQQPDASPEGAERQRRHRASVTSESE